MPFIDSTTNPIWGNPERIPRYWRMGQDERWRRYVWRAWRNPTYNLRYVLQRWFHSPPVSIYGSQNPDADVRLDGFEKSWQALAGGVFWMYWYLADTGSMFRPYFEVRIGWKLPQRGGALPTLSIRWGG